jgi:hypothetical protein
MVVAALARMILDAGENIPPTACYNKHGGPGAFRDHNTNGLLCSNSRSALHSFGREHDAGSIQSGTHDARVRSSGRDLSCRTFAANAVRLQLHALAYNLGNFTAGPTSGRHLRAAQKVAIIQLKFGVSSGESRLI